VPELPEVETTLRGIEPHILNLKVTNFIVRERNLRWDVPVTQIRRYIIGNKFYSINRRAKYLILQNNKGSVLIHLGMSGCLRIFSEYQEPEKHDHIDFGFINGSYLRFTDPRKFGSVLWTKNPDQHHLLKKLGPEPLGNSFSGDYLFKKSRGKKVSIKNFIMNSNIVSGVGNIYASEALFMAKIRPQKVTGKTTLSQLELLAESIKSVLRNSIDLGGTTLRDFVGSTDEPGYFKPQLMVYGRKEEKCKVCATELKEVRLSQRSSVFCPKCQS